MSQWRTGKSWTIREQARVLWGWSDTQGPMGLWGGKGDCGYQVEMEASKEGDDKDDWAHNWGVRMKG